MNTDANPFAGYEPNATSGTEDLGGDFDLAVVNSHNIDHVNLFSCQPLVICIASSSSHTCLAPSSALCVRLVLSSTCRLPGQRTQLCTLQIRSFLVFQDIHPPLYCAGSALQVHRYLAAVCFFHNASARPGELHLMTCLCESRYRH